MTTVYPLTLPSYTDFQAEVWAPANMVGVSRSPFTGEPRKFDWLGRLWVFQLTFNVLSLTNGPKWEAFFLQLRGQYGTFNFGDPKRRSPLGTVTGSPLVNGANQTGELLILNGAGNAKTWKAGDYFELENNLYMVLVDAVSDGPGNVTLTVWPELRSSPADNAVITIVNPEGVFSLLDKQSFNVNSVLYDGGQFAIVEEPQ